MLHCTTTYCNFDGAPGQFTLRFLGYSCRPGLFQYLYNHDNPLVTSLISVWSHAHNAMDTTTLRHPNSCMLHRNVSSALASDGKTIHKQIMKPIGNFISQATMRRLWDSIQPLDALQMLWHLLQEISITVPASYHGPLAGIPAGSSLGIKFWFVLIRRYSPLSVAIRCYLSLFFVPQMDPTLHSM